MNVKQTDNLGSLFSIFAGILYAISGILFIGFQVGRFNWDSIHSILLYLQTAPRAMLIWSLINWGAALASLFAIANIQLLMRKLKALNEDLVIWAGFLAVFGYCIIAVTNIADLNQIQRLDEARENFPGMKMSYHETAFDAVEIIGVGSLDPDLTLRFITLGPWFLTIGGLTFRNRHIPNSLAVVGIFLGAAALLLVIANWFGQKWLLSVCAPVSVVLHPLWLIWTGLVFRKL